MDEFKVAI